MLSRNWTLQWDVVRDDYMAMYRNVFFSGERGEQLLKTARRVHGIFSLVTTTAIATIATVAFAPRPFLSTAFVIYFVLFFVILFLIDGIRWLARRTQRNKPGFVDPAIKRMLKVYAKRIDRNPEVAAEGPMTLEATDDNVITQFDGSTSAHEWAVFQEVLDVPGYVYLVHRDHGAIGIADRAFASPEERAAFISDVRERIQQGAQSGAP